jgi:5'-deoxynucleotidase YfbR-like HD superfamily hydrolase
MYLLGEECSGNLLKAALTHDLEEGLTGDIPAPAKWDGGNVLDALEAKVRKYYEIPCPELSDLERGYLKAADFLDACLSCLEQRMLGNQFVDIVFERLKQYADPGAEQDFDARFWDLYVNICTAYYGQGYASILSRKMKGNDYWLKCFAAK